jgi:hypothetical protein
MEFVERLLLEVAAIALQLAVLRVITWLRERAQSYGESPVAVLAS